MSPGAHSIPSDNSYHLGEDLLLAALHFCLVLWDRSKPHRLFLWLQLAASSQKEDVTQPPCNVLFLVTSAPSSVTFHTTEWRERDAGPLPGSPRAGLSEAGSLHAVKRNPLRSTQGTRVLVQKVVKHCQLLFGAAALKRDPAKKVTG